MSGYLGRVAVLPFLCFATILSSTVVAQNPSRDDALDNPSKHAWDLFIVLNQPALAPSLGKRGAPDPGKQLGAPGTTTVWETWRAATPEVFIPDGTKPPASFDDMSLVNSCPSGKVPELPTKGALISRAIADSTGSGQVHSLFNPDQGIGQPGSGGFGETRINRSTYKTILDNGLYNKDGQIAYAVSVIAGTRPSITFEIDSIEVKAGWIQLSTQQDASKYYSVQWAGNYYGLQTLHILSKDLPNWFWATFRHKNGPPDQAPTNPDTYGQPPAIKGTVWENYQLTGTQTNFVDSMGRDTILSDSYIEQDFKHSSCITCHANASIGADGKRLSPEPKTAADGTPLPAGSAATGIPPYKPYFDAQGKLSKVQTDFVWSVIRAQSTSLPQPNTDPCATAAKVK